MREQGDGHRGARFQAHFAVALASARRESQLGGRVRITRLIHIDMAVD